MKKSVVLVLVLALLVTVVSVFAQEKIVIGATPTPHVIVLQQIQEALKAEGYELEIVEFTDYVLPNPATSAGELTANYFQHLPYLNAYNAEVKEADRLFAAVPVHYEPFGLYAGQKKSLDEVAEGDRIAIPNDPSNETRALLLLQEAGMIRLKDDITPNSTATVLDIVENIKGVVVEEVNAELLPSVLGDVAYAVINGNYALKANLKPATDALFLEPKDSDAAKVYANYIVVRNQDAESPIVEALKKVLYTKEVYDFLLNHPEFAGGVVPAFEPAQ